MKNLKAVLTNLIAVLVGILTFVFMSQPYYNVVIDSILGGGSLTAINGYSIIEQGFQSEQAKDVILAICLVLVAVLAGILILLGIFNLATSTGAVKVKNPKTANAINVFVSILMIVFNVVILCIISSYTTGGEYISGSCKIAWALIVNFILSFVALTSTLIASIGKKKSSKRK